MILFQHLDVRVLRQAAFAGAGEVGGFPAGAVEVLLNLRRHVSCNRPGALGVDADQGQV